MTGVLAPRVSPGRAREHGVLRAWTVSVSMGELAGFCVPALVGGLLREEPPLLVLGAMLLSVLVAVLLGTLLLCSIGRGQRIELRRHVPRAARWLLITAAGWGAGLFVSMAVATPLWRPGQPTPTIIATGLGAGALMAVSMAGLTGWGTEHLIDLGDRVRRPVGNASGRPQRRPWRRTFVAVEGLVALGGAAGTVQLLAGIATPPDSALDPFERFGVSGWELPALWLLVSVAVPSAVAAAAALHGSPRAPEWVLFASAMLALELVVQMPFLGLNVLQAVFGTVAVVMAALAWQARRSGGWSPAAPAVPAAPVAIAHECPNSTDSSRERVRTAHGNRSDARA